jgi:hypothetical protein
MQSGRILAHDDAMEKRPTQGAEKVGDCHRESAPHFVREPLALAWTRFSEADWG